MPPTSSFKDRLHHRAPSWVPDGETYHIRIRCEWVQAQQGPLTSDGLGAALLGSARYYHQLRRWYCHVFVLMPDHLHLIAQFPWDEAMSTVIHDWKRWLTRQHSVAWQDGYFDHRIRGGHEFERKTNYIRQNPVVKGLCAKAEDWPWRCEPARELG